MRISDWSSDVCSSDLGLAEKEAGRRGRHDGLLLPRGERRLGGALDAAEAMFVERAAQPADDHPAHELRIAEAHLGLRRVDVDVDLAGRQIEEERDDRVAIARRSEEHTSELQSLMRLSYAVF